MITSIETQRLLVVSDIHLGNRLFHARRQFIEFLRYACDTQSDVCINGDGIDISQTSIRQITREISACSNFLRRLRRCNLRVFYIVGNHDIVLENFLDDWGVVNMVPYLNVESSGTRIHIEHGHLFDNSFMQFPRLYLLFTRLGGLCLKVHPRLYKALEKMKPLGDRLRRLVMPSVMETSDDVERIPNEPAGFYEAAAEIARLGFDYVILGHTHCQGLVQLPDRATYMNTGSWLFDPYFVEIEDGQVRMFKLAEVDLDVMKENNCCEFPAQETPASIPAET